MKENIALILQGVTLCILVFIVLRRQANDLFVHEEEPGAQFTKNILFIAAVIIAILCSMGFIRMLYLMLNHHSTWLLDNMTFWANRLVFLVNGISGLLLYRNKRELT